MRAALGVLLLVCLAMAEPPAEGRAEARDERGQFAYRFQTGDYLNEAQGALKRVGDSNVLVQKGRFRYSSAGGQPLEVEYVADENGYQPRGAHLPVPPVPVSEGPYP